jgi:signal transduction histidine kinase
MIEASAKLKFILFVDAILFLLCVAGLISIDQKAKLPFELTTQDSLLSIKIQDSNPYGLSTGDKLILVDGIKVNLVEKTEFITDRKNIGERISISVLTKSGAQTFLVVLSNYYSTFYLISTSIVALLFLIIAVFVLLKKSEMKAAHVFHWASVCLSIMLCLTWSNLNTLSFISKYLLRISLLITYVVTPALFVNFTLVFPRDNSVKWRKFLTINYLIAFLLAIINIYAFVVTLSVFSESSIDNYLNAFNILRIYLIIGVILSITFFVSALFREKGKVERQQLKWLLFGFIIGPLSFVILWVLPILFVDKALVPEEMVMILLCAIPITFAIAIIKYHLLDIDEVLNRSLVYGIVISILLVLYSAAIGIFVSSFKVSDQSIVSAVAAVLLALAFQPIKTRVQQFVDKKFFRVQYNFRKELNRFTSQIKNYNDINSLGEYLIREIDNLIPVDKIAFCELATQTGKLLIRAQKNFDQIANKSLRIKPETLERKWFQIAAVKNKVEGDAIISTIFQNTLVRWKINLVVPIKSVKEELYGFIILGNKKSGSKFSIEDVDLLKDIGINVGSTIERIRLQEQLVREKIEVEKLEELNQHKSMFVSTVSHDFKTPLTSIKIFSEMLLENEKTLSDKSKNHLEIIEGETDRLTRLINNVLDFSKIEKGIKTYSFRQIHINKIVSDVIELMQYTLKMKEFNLETKLGDFKDLIYGDADAITEAIENIISNAIRFSTGKKEVSISTYYKDNFAIVSVKDNGIGIIQSDIEKIFDPFFRSENAKAKKIDGTGLGLPIVKHIMEEHKGKILIESTPDLGSNFTLCFPVLSNNERGYDEENINY